MESLYKLGEVGAAVADQPEFQRGEGEWDWEYFKPHLEPTDIEADLEAVECKVDEVVDTYEVGDAAIDREMAEPVHRNIRLTRAQAADERIWHYLAIVRFPEFVRHRWPREGANRTQKSMQEKFKGTHRDIYSNAFHRLWWIAELTCEDGDYERTERALETQRLANTVFDRRFGRSEPAIKACIDVLAGESDEVIEKTTLRLNHALSTVPVECLSESRLRYRVGKIRDDVND